MTPEEILSYPAKILTQEQREHHFEYGYVGKWSRKSLKSAKDLRVSIKSVSS